MARGEKTGGRSKGTQNKATSARFREIAESGLTPLDYMLNILRAEVPPELKERIEKEALSVDLINALSSWNAQRFEAAKAAAPYVHPRLQNTAVSGPDGGPLIVNVIKFADQSPSK